MGFSNKGVQRKVVERVTHPIWRGIGCILFILVPLMSFSAAHLFIESNLDIIGIPYALRNTVNTFIFGYVHFFNAKLLLGVIVTIALFAIIFMLYSFMYNVSGGNKRGPMDVAPSRHKIKKRNR